MGCDILITQINVEFRLCSYMLQVSLLNIIVYYIVIRE